MLVPDPASRFQPLGCAGAQRSDRPRSVSLEEDWRGRSWHDAVLYELHVGAFTPEGTFDAAAEKLDHLADLGVTAVEIMPVGDFPRPMGLGLRRRASLRARRELRPPGAFQGLCRGGAPARRRRAARRRLQPLRTGGNFLPRYAPDFLPTATRPRGAMRSISTGRIRGRSATSSSKTPSTGSSVSSRRTAARRRRMRSRTTAGRHSRRAGGAIRTRFAHRCIC